VEKAALGGLFLIVIIRRIHAPLIVIRQIHRKSFKLRPYRRHESNFNDRGCHG
jgi:hypothetical protein